MRYVIMIQVVGIVTLFLLGTSAMFAWLQNRSLQQPLEPDNTSLSSRSPVASKTLESIYS